MVLPRHLTTAYKSTLNQIEEENKMKYITSVELMAMREGREEGMEKGMEKGKILGQIELLKKFRKMKMLAKDQYHQMLSSLKSQLKELSQANQTLQTACA